MHPVEALKRLGGVGDRKTILRMTTARRLRTAVSRGDVIKAGRGCYTLVTTQAGLKAASTLSGIASHESAALWHGWEIKLQPERPHVIVPRHRKVSPRRKRGVQVWFRDLHAHEHDGLVTTKERTALDSMRDLPFDRALAVADSAIRHGDLTRDQLVELALTVPTRGRGRAMRVALAADGSAANPFESVLRAIALDVPGLDVKAQVVISEGGFVCRPDLVDVKRRIVIEADSYEFHSSRKSLRKDIERYTNLVVRGWTVVRFAWEHVMFEPHYVRACLVALVQRQEGLAIPAGRARKSA
ncbi:MAG TPA: DUF559 domain-containing protein [Nocardioidaceae bacterium]|nr:DUF559 domain-containing protein [Nocardioidaceae bacterium]